MKEEVDVTTLSQQILQKNIISGHAIRNGLFGYLHQKISLIGLSIVIKLKEEIYTSSCNQIHFHTYI
jgi:hypothetical protein